MITVILMIFLIFGYLLFVLVLVLNIDFPLEMITGSVFFGWACFVYIVVRFTRRTVDDLQREITARRKVEDDLQHSQNTLELRVIERTNQLSLVNQQLKEEVASRVKAEEQLRSRAFYDQLTSLPNRALFMELLQSAIEHKKRNRDFMFAVFFMDADRFKVINDSLGHLVGDQLLVMFAQRLSRQFRGVDKLARFGGDEFVVLLEDIKNVSDVHIVAMRIFNSLKEPFNLYGHEVFVSFSIGITTSEMSSYEKTDDLLRDADTALYDAKVCGKGCHSVFERTMHAHAVTILQLEMELRRAIERHEFRLHYQAIVATGDRRIVGFEALIRWQHPERGIVFPQEFLLLAEETDLIISIGRWTLAEACRQMSEWQKKYPEYHALTMSVNMSGREFLQADFVEFIEKALEETGINPSSLRLEITEKMILSNPESAMVILTRLKSLNVRFDIDDFGTGHSALNYLCHFPVNAIKIDRSFINTLTSDKDNAEIVKTIVSLAQSLKLEVIAEGVESQVQMEIFKGMKGKYAQGYFFHKPIESKDAEALLRGDAGS